MAASTQVSHDLLLAPELLGLNVLLVDDDPIQLKLAAAHLLDAGFEVTTASSVSDAIDLARLTLPDVIVSDVVMDELDGFALCGMMRAEPALEGTPILLMSAHVDGRDDQQMAESMGANAIVQRSPGFEAEWEALRKLLTTARRPQAHADPSMSRIAPQMSRLLARSRSAEDRYRTLFDNASEAISVSTPDGVILEANRRWEEILHLSKDEMIGRHIRDFAAPGYSERNHERYLDLVNDGQGTLTGVPITGPDGSLIYMEFSSRVVETDGESVVLSIGRDITERVIARRQLAASEERYRTLVEGIPDVVWSARTDGKVLYISARAERICGFTPLEITEGGPEFWFRRVHPEDIADMRKAWTEIVGGTYKSEYRWQHRDGQWIWLRSHATLRTDQEGNLIAEGTFADVTSQKQLEHQLQVSQKMEAIARLTGGIAHDFNNMLGVVLGNAEFLLGDLPEQDPRRGDVESILEAGQRAAALTRQLLTFSRHQVVEQREVDLGRIVRDLEKMLHRVIGEDVELVTRFTDDLGTVRADVGQLEQIVMNLVVNARDAMPQGGTISIATSRTVVEEPLELGESVMSPGDYAVLTVTDTGCGMDEATRRRIFEPFFTTKAVGKGTGLGLSTCYGIVKQSRGHISVYSEPGRGTTIKVYLPRTAAQDERDWFRQSGPLASFRGGETILLVEDNAQLRSVIRRTLTSLGYDVLEAGDGDNAVAMHAAHAGCIDLVLTDVVMPGAGGPDVVSLIRRHGGQPKVLYMSGYTEHAALRDYRLDAGLNFIQKPFSPATIARKVRTVLDETEGR